MLFTHSACYQYDQEDSIKCSELLNCAGSYDAFGSCDACKGGFLGEYCLERGKVFFAYFLFESIWILII